MYTRPSSFEANVLSHQVYMQQISSLVELCFNLIILSCYQLYLYSLLLPMKPYFILGSRLISNLSASETTMFRSKLQHVTLAYQGTVSQTKDKAMCTLIPILVKGLEDDKIKQCTNLKDVEMRIYLSQCSSIEGLIIESDKH